MPPKKRKMPQRIQGKFTKKTPEPVIPAKSPTSAPVTLPIIVVTPAAEDSNWIFLDDPQDEDFIYSEDALDEEDRAPAVRDTAFALLQAHKAQALRRGAYASSFTSRAKTTVNRNKRRARMLEDFETSRQIPHIQSTIPFAPKPKAPFPARIMTPTIDDVITLISDESDNESESEQFVSTDETHVTETSQKLADPYAELIEDWIQGQEVTVAGGIGTVAVELELEAYAGGIDNDIGDEDDGEENEGKDEVSDEGHHEDEVLSDGVLLRDEDINDNVMMNTLVRVSANGRADDIASAALEADTPNDTHASDTPLTVTEALERIDCLLSGKGKKAVALHPAAIAPLSILRNFFIRRLKGDGMMLASVTVASIWRMGKGVALARRIRYLARFFLRFRRLPAETRGGIRAGSSLLKMEAVHTAVSSWLESQSIGSITPRRFRQAIADLLPTLGYLPDAAICERTARRWLKKLGYTPKPTKKGVYEDGHEREDVVKYRIEEFLPAMAEKERRSVGFEPDGDGWKRIEPQLVNGEKRTVIYYHDESCFHQKDFRKTNWLHTTQQILPGKGQGRIIHVSDFVTNATPSGRLLHTQSQSGEIMDARVIIKPGAQGDPWWDTKQLIVQVERAMAIHDLEFGDDVEAVFIFDQSSAHNSSGDGALDAFGMNKGSVTKRKNAVWYKDTIVPDDVPNVALRGMVQRLMSEEDPTQPKGTARILAERGIVPKPKTVAKCQPRCYETAIDCCFARILHNQLDFKEQKSALETVVSAKEHSVVFLPKFHCECNPIEMYWGYAKYLYRQVEKKGLEHAQGEVVKALEGCGGDRIKRFINRALRFMSAYRLGLTGQAAVWAVKKQKSHRRVSAEAMASLEAAVAAKDVVG